VSRAYRIRVADTLRQHAEIKDGIRTRLELLPVLPAERMAAILKSQLEARGFTCDGAVATRELGEGVSIRVDIESSHIEIVMAEELALQVSGELSQVVEEEEAEQREKQLQQALAAQLCSKVDEAQDEARQALTQKLKRRLGDIQQELDQLVNATIATALKEKAAQLGEVEEVVESEDGSISIRINL